VLPNELIAIILLGSAFAAICLGLAHLISFMIPALHQPVFIPSADDQLKTMLALPRLTKRSKVIDLGSGDGKVLISLAQQFGVKGTGVETNPILVRRSRQKIAAANLSKKLTILKQSFWDTDLSKYDVVFFYGTGYVMKKLEEKVKSEMKRGAQFVSNHFQFPTLKPTKTVNGVRLYQF
jgi:precorrin-6B methylase 2